MKKMAAAFMAFSLFLMAEKAVMVKVQSEDRIVVKRNGRLFSLHLAGIASFTTAVNGDDRVDWRTREEFSARAQHYLSMKLPAGSVVEYAVIDDGNRGGLYVWIEGAQELNYRMVREGYALVNSADSYLPGALEMRMKVAMAYARKRHLGLWKRDQMAMAAMNVPSWRSGKRPGGYDTLKRSDERLAKQNPAIKNAESSPRLRRDSVRYAFR